LIAAERVFDELSTEVSVFWTEDVVSLKARLDFLNHAASWSADRKG
jgi:hypothetical protein